MNKIIKYLLIFVGAVFVFTLLYNPDYKKRCFKVLEKEKKDIVIGVVVEKYHVRQDMYPYLEIRQNADSSIIKKSFHAEFSGIFDSTQIGDSIYKPKGSLIYTIVNDTTEIKLKFTMFCNE